MKLLTSTVFALAVVVLLVSLAHYNEAGSKKALKHLKKLAAVALMSRRQKSMALPIPLPLFLPIPVIKKEEEPTWPSWPSWPPHEEHHHHGHHEKSWGSWEPSWSSWGPSW